MCSLKSFGRFSFWHGKELSVLLKALRAHEEVQIVLSSPIPSASQIVKDAKTVHALSLLPSTINHGASTTHLTPSIQSPPTHHPPTSLISFSFNHAALPIFTATVTSPDMNPSLLAPLALIPSTINQAALTAHATPVYCTDPATMALFREYGSGLLNEWLDSLLIPRIVENLQQVTET